MTMANLTAATAAIQALEAAYSGKMAAIDAAIATAAQVVGDTRRVLYVDSVAGDDQAAGTQAEPIRTLDETVTRSVFGGRTEVTLLSDYTLSTRLSLRDGTYFLKGATGSEKLIFADATTGHVSGAGTKFSPHIAMSTLATHLRLSDMEINLGSYGALNDIDVAINMAWYGQLLFENVDFGNVATSDQSVLLHGIASSFAAISYTSDAALDGRWIDGIAAGTDPATLPELMFTNIGSL